MSSRRQANIDKYLYEIIEDYKSTNLEEEKNEILKSFCSSIWASDNKRRIYTKTIRFTVRKDLLDTDVGQVFNTWSEVEYKGYKSMSKETDWCSLIRQKINNLYTRYFDKEVILKRDYMDLLKTPKMLYYRWISGEEMSADELTTLIDDAIDESGKLRATYQKQKMDLSWNDYKKVVEEFLKKIFNNCKLIDDYEDKTKLNHIYDFINEDNFYIRYFCKYLENEMKQWEKKYYGVRNHKKCKRCKLCGALIEKSHNRKEYCTNCKKKMELERYKKYNKKRNHN